MDSKEKVVYHYTYLITDKLNNMFYFGVRSSKCTPEEDTNYMSSSKYLKEAINRFGSEHFMKEIYEQYDTRLEATEAEEKYLKSVNAGYCDEYYNKTNGNLHFCTQGLTKENSELMRENSERNLKDWKENKEAKIAKIHHPDRDYSNHLISLAKGRGKGKSKLEGDNRTEAQKAQSEAARERMSRKDNPVHSAEAQAKRIATITGGKRPRQSELMTGRVAINRGGVCKMVHKDELDSYLVDGWVKGGNVNLKKRSFPERVCPHCCKQGKGPNMSRYHFDNCKHKGEIDE